ncbi:hypothetical protein QNI19_25170 [Cytophagaceae bacterium DM2B3-1]|uniref:Uncharacterized protein n=1 Tax=Xanthocytophaga flava TaxID=3048013 RepID=A0AAE3QNU3_9BACT|nr:hypothetical protein [Xanthocytophaga flavus]MDJ1466910.1 hypothetical protein [Xanthocytophaga flavus]MDJ1482772.1 hypothetical protein [Xanthocytophaga flavus]MDJ1496254.1 hypothetical protein [Xanthocytophaga flavus]
MQNIHEFAMSFYRITKVCLHNYTNPDGELWIEICGFSKDLVERKIIFETVSGVHLESEWGTGLNYSSSIIVIDDITSAQLENKNYHIQILEDSLTFYCKRIVIE